MSKRTASAIAIVAATLGISGVAPAVAHTLVTKPPRQPNIVVILTDDLDATTTPFWKAMPKTKKLIAARGLTFANSFAPDPICCPARSTILTGKDAHNTGVLTNGGPHGGWKAFVANGNEEHTVAVALHDGGYRTGLIGKYLNGYETDPTHVPPGWDDWIGAADNGFYVGYNYTLNENGTLVRYGHEPSDYSTDVVSRKAVEFIDASEANDRQPFYLELTSTAPHVPLGPPPRYANNRFANANVPEPPNYFEADISDKSAWLQASGDARLKQKERTNTDYRNRMGSLLAVDDMIAAVVKDLDQKGELANTYLVFTSDNGYNNGSHRLIHKMAPYEESLRVPLVIAGPGVRHGTDTHMVVQTDYTPTFLDLAHLRVPNDVDGISFAVFLRGKQPKTVRRDFLGQYGTGGAANGIGAEMPPEQYIQQAAIVMAQDIPGWIGIRTERYLYVEWDPAASPDGTSDVELYDLKHDRYELSNLLATPQGEKKNAGLVETLQRRMHTLERCRGKTCRT